MAPVFPLAAAIGQEPIPRYVYWQRAGARSVSLVRFGNYSLRRVENTAASLTRRTPVSRRWYPDHTWKCSLALGVRGGRVGVSGSTRASARGAGTAACSLFRKAMHSISAFGLWLD